MKAVEGCGRHLEKPDASGFSCICAMGHLCGKPNPCRIMSSRLPDSEAKGHSVLLILDFSSSRQVNNLLRLFCTFSEDSQISGKVDL